MIMLNDYLRDTFGCKVYRLAIDGGFTCPNRDGTIGHGGCIFCSQSGSGDFATDRQLGITGQIEEAKRLVERKVKNGKYIAYFQAFTNTYAPVEYLRKVYTEALMHPDVAALSIATRPDCLPDPVIGLIAELNTIKPVWVELGLQTINEAVASYIRRGYSLKVYDDAVLRLSLAGITTIVHVILGLPGESMADMLKTVQYVAEGKVSGIKLQLLHVLKGTDLEKDYRAGLFKTLEFDEYIDIVMQCLKILPKDMVVHRMTGDGARKDLVAPLWSTDKKRILNELNRRIREEIKEDAH